MLYSVIIGDGNSGLTNDWTLSNDSYDNTFISNESIRQRIRLGKKVNKKLDNVYSDEKSAAYEIATNTFLSNNNKNMNLSLMNFWTQNPEVNANHIDDNILYITFLNKDYRMIEYKVYNREVIQTYRNRGEYQGLAITFKALDTFDVVMFTMLAKDLKNNNFVEINVSIDENGKIKTTYDEIVNPDVINDCKFRLKKLGTRFHHFMMDVDGFPTNTFIIDNKYAEKIKDLLIAVPNAQVISLIGGSAAFDDDITDEEKESVREILQACIVDQRVRAITTVGIRLPKTFCKTYNILYHFNYDIKNNKLTCVKSN